jgi:hypothetical protein
MAKKSDRRLDSYLLEVLRNEMVTPKNTHITPRLDWCRIVASRKLPPCEKAVNFEERLGTAAMAVIPRKIDDLYSWLIDIIVRAFEKVFVVEATDIPTLSPEVKEQVRDTIVATLQTLVQQRAAFAAQRVQAEYGEIGVAVSPEQAVAIADNRPGESIVPDEDTIRDLIADMRSEAMAFERQEAAEGASRLQRLISDIIQETGALEEIMQFIHDFTVYPFAVMAGGVMKRTPVRKWTNKGLKRDVEYKTTIRRVSPYDFFWTRDGTTSQDALGVAERMTLRRNQLNNFRERSYALGDRIDEILVDYEDMARDWLAVKENPEENTSVASWSGSPHETVDVFRMFIWVTGEHIKEYADSLPLDDTFDVGEQYHIEAWISCDKLIGIRLHDQDTPRPYNAVSYEEVPGTLCGNALAENLKVVNATARRTFIHLVNNMGKSTNPSTLVDRAMLGDTLEEDEPLLPDTQYDFTRNLGVTSRPVELLEFPNYMGQLISFLEYLDGRADVESGIPKYALGQAQGLPSALRSVAALKLMIDSALKTMTSRVFRIGRQVIAPSIRLVVDNLMDDPDNQKWFVDANVVVYGVDGVIRQTMVIDNITSILQYLAPFRQSGDVAPGVIKQLVDQFLVEAGVDNTDLLSAEESLGNAADQLADNTATQSDLVPGGQPI